MIGTISEEGNKVFSMSKNFFFVESVKSSSSCHRQKIGAIKVLYYYKGPTMAS